MNESSIVTLLKECKVIYVSYSIFFSKVTSPCFYLSSLEEETYIGLRIDESYFDNEDSGYYSRLEEELNSKRKATIYGVYEDGSLLILECFKTAVMKSLLVDLDKSLKEDPYYFIYRLSELSGYRYSPKGDSARIKDINRYLVKDEEEHRYTDTEPALRYFRERISDYISYSGAFIKDEAISPDSDFPSLLPLPLYEHFLAKKNSDSLSEEEMAVVSAIESLFFSFSLNETIEEEDFLLSSIVSEALAKKKRYDYEEGESHIRISIEEGLLKIDCLLPNASMQLSTNAFSSSYSKSYYFSSHIKIAKEDRSPEEYDLDITYGKSEDADSSNGDTPLPI